MPQIIRYGIIGCGSMGREHIENIKALEGTEITAIADPDPACPIRHGGRCDPDGRKRRRQH